MAVSYACKMFMKLTPGHVLVDGVHVVNVGLPVIPHGPGVNVIKLFSATLTLRAY